MDQAVVTPTPITRKRAWSIWLPRIAILLLIGLAGYFAAKTGLRFRHWMWDTTAPIRYVPDIDRGYQWGRLAAVEGYLNQYEKMQPEQPTDREWLDYGPLRLALMAYWGRWSLSHFPQVHIWHENHSYALTAPVLHFNLFMEVIGLMSAFFLTRFWYLQGSRSSPTDSDSVRYFFRGWIPALAAVLLLWFNPAIVLSAYGWPTWDLWIIPVFLLAALLASLDSWFTAGVVVGIGTMLKGQQMLAIPVFVIWSLVPQRPLMTLRFLGGAVIAIAMIVSPWLLTYIPPDQLARAREIQATFGQPFLAPMMTFKLSRVMDIPALLWVMGILVASTILPWVSWLTLKKTAVIEERWQKIMASPLAWRTIAAFTAFALVVWPWLLKRNRPDWQIGFSAGCLLACCVLLIRPRGIGALAATSTGIAMLLCMSIFHGSSAWYDCGIHFGTIHWPWMYMGLTENLPAILVNDFNWPMENLDITAFTIPAHWLLNYPADAIDVSMKVTLQGLFWITFIPCCIGLGLHARWRNRRVLIALVAPWLMFFCFPPQVHERYLLFAAGLSCICAGASVGMTLIGVLVSMVTFAMTLHVMLSSVTNHQRFLLGQNLARQFPSMLSENAGDKLLKILNGTRSDSDIGYAVVLCGLIFLYLSVAPRRRYK